MVVDQTKFWEEVKLENCRITKSTISLILILYATAIHSLGLHLPLHLQQIMYDLCFWSVDYQKLYMGKFMITRDIILNVLPFWHHCFASVLFLHSLNSHVL